MQCSLQITKKKVDEVDFLYTDKHQYFLQVNFNTFDIKVSYKIILSLLMGMIKHYQNTQSSKFAISLQCLKKLIKMFWAEVASHVQSSQNRKLVKFDQYLKKKL